MNKQNNYILMSFLLGSFALNGMDQAEDTPLQMKLVRQAQVENTSSQKQVVRQVVEGLDEKIVQQPQNPNLQDYLQPIINTKLIIPYLGEPVSILSALKRLPKPDDVTLSLNDRISALTCTSDGRYILAGSQDGFVGKWDRFKNYKKQKLCFHNDRINAMALSKKDRFLATASNDGTVQVWSLDNEEENRMFLGHEDQVVSVAFSPDAHFLVSGSADMTARIWDLNSGESKILVGHTAPLTAVAWSPDGKYIVTGARDDSVKVWYSDTALLVKTIEIEAGVWREDGVYNPAGVYSVVFSPDGRYLAIAAGNNVTLYDLNTTSLIRKDLIGHEGTINSLAFSADSKLLVTGSDDMTARIWNLMKGKTVQSLEGHVGCVFGVAFSPDGRFVVTGATDGKVRLWNWRNGAYELLGSHKEFITRVAFSPDGCFVVTGSADSKVCVWVLNERIENLTSLNLGKGLLGPGLKEDRPNQKIDRIVVPQPNGTTLLIPDSKLSDIVLSADDGKRMSAASMIAFDNAVNFLKSNKRNPVLL